MTIAKFEDHCWKDIVTPEILETYTPYHRETFIGLRYWPSIYTILSMRAARSSPTSW